MIKVNIYTVGKAKETWLCSAIEDYVKRLKNRLTIKWIFVKNSLKLKETLKKESRFIALDPQGKSLSSPALSRLIEREWTDYGAKIAFLIGGPCGLEKELLKRASHQITLSRLTFTHQMTRLILLEQLYRSVQIIDNTPYHKD